MRITPQVLQVSIVAIGHFNPLIFRQEWLSQKELVIGNDQEELVTELLHSEIAIYRLPWGTFHCDREQFVISTQQEPVVVAHDFFVRCFQLLPETPIRAIGINKEIHFSAGGRAALDKIGDTVAPKDFWEPLLGTTEKRLGGLRSVSMEQATLTDKGKTRLDGRIGHIQFKVEPSLRLDIPFGVYCHVNDHYDFAPMSDGRSASELVAEVWDTSMAQADHWFDQLMELINVD